MIVDSSAILAIFFAEPERDDFLRRIRAASTVGIGGPTLVETTTALASRVGDVAFSGIDAFLVDTRLVVISFDGGHWRVAVDAWRRFGRGRHPARLNFGDCLAYATANVAGEPLLAKGDDFAKTDIELA